MLRDRGADWIHALPIFPYRAFHHSTLHVRRDSMLTEPVQLHGKRVGVPDFSMTAAVSTRGILRDAYGVAWQDIHWVSGRGSRFAVAQDGMNPRRTVTAAALVVNAADIEEQIAVGCRAGALGPCKLGIIAAGRQA